MVEYRRLYEKGGLYFFTVNLHDRSSTVLVDHIDVLSHSMRLTQQRYPFGVNAIVVLPEHLHCLWQLPKNDDDFSIRWQMIKTCFTKRLRHHPNVQISCQTNSFSLWQRRFWEHCIRDQSDYENHVNYIHYNPVKQGYVTDASLWKWSSLHRFIRLGLLPSNWGQPGRIYPKQPYGE